MDEIFEKIDQALSRLEQKIIAQKKQFIFEKTLLGEELEKNKNNTQNIKSQAESALKKIDNLIETLEKNYKES